MQTYSTWRIEPTKILTRRELACVLADLKQRATRSESARLNLVIFRLACCCGLRASEIAGLRCDDVIVGVARPHLRIRAQTAKGGRGRQVPLWWDAGTLADLEVWKTIHVVPGVTRAAPFVCCQKPSRRGEPLKRHSLRRRFLTACKTLGRERLRTLTIHHGRHTFISHALAGGRSLADVPPKDPSGIEIFGLGGGCYDFCLGAFGAGWMVPAALSRESRRRSMPSRDTKERSTEKEGLVRFR